jgi:hypothetical protein
MAAPQELGAAKAPDESRAVLLLGCARELPGTELDPVDDNRALDCHWPKECLLCEATLLGKPNQLGDIFL